MISISQIVVLALFAASAQAQMKSTTEIDGKLALNFENLRGAEANLNVVINNYYTTINAVLVNTTNGSSIYAALTTMSNVTFVLKTVDNHVQPNATKTCDDINMQIISIDLDIRLQQTIIKQISTNSTLLSRAVNTATMAYIKSRKTLDASVPTLRQLLSSQAKLVQTSYNNYRQLLTMVITSLNQIKTNLNLYKRQYCNCPTAITTSQATQVSTLESNIGKIQGNLVAKQTEFKASLDKITTAATLANSLVTSAKLKTIYQTISSFVTTQTSVDPYAKITVNSTSCSDVQARVASTKYMVAAYKV
jgi:hypothetical protein